MEEPFLALAAYIIGVFVMVTVMLVLSYFLGQRHSERATGAPFESGILVTGSARLRFDVRFYLIAMFFVIFDLEAVYLFAWAVSAREAGWAGYGGGVVFTVLLVAALAYVWRTGGLDVVSPRATPRTAAAVQAAGGAAAAPLPLPPARQEEDAF